MPRQSKAGERALKKSGRKPPPPGPGRPKGSLNKTTRLLKDAVLMAGELAGRELKPQSEDGLVSYLTWLSKTQPAAYTSLLGKILPTQVTGEDGGPIQQAITVVSGVPRADD